MNRRTFIGTMVAVPQLASLKPLPRPPRPHKGRWYRAANLYDEIGRRRMFDGLGDGKFTAAFVVDPLTGAGYRFEIGYRGKPWQEWCDAAF